MKIQKNGIRVNRKKFKWLSGFGLIETRVGIEAGTHADTCFFCIIG